MPGEMARSDPRPSVRVTRGAGSGQHLASVLQEGRENANIDAGLGFIWRISAKTMGATPSSAILVSVVRLKSWAVHRSEVNWYRHTMSDTTLRLTPNSPSASLRSFIARGDNGTE